MSRTAFREVLAALDLSDRLDEQESRTRMIHLLDTTPNCFHRSCFPGHFTGSTLVVSANGQQALLHHHRKLDRWLQFGGHCDGDEDVLRVAQREAFEESGIENLILASPKPFDLDIHEIPAKDSEPAHFHFDVRYVLIAPENSEFKTSSESIELRWFTPDEMETLELDPGLKRMLLKWRKLLARRAAHSA
ncbi:MAG: NUDIX hydrolase [Verrucomicrobiota bacterium]